MSGLQFSGLFHKKSLPPPSHALWASARLAPAKASAISMDAEEVKRAREWARGRRERFLYIRGGGGGRPGGRRVEPPALLTDAERQDFCAHPSPQGVVPQEHAPQHARWLN